MEDAALQRQAKFLGNSSVSTTLTFTDKAKVCELCATFRISGSAVFPVFSDYRWDRPKSQAQHDLHEEYQDVFPNFPNLKQRAKDGCSFCGFVRQSLQSEYRISEGWPAFSETPVRIVFTASVAEEVDNGSLRTILDKLKRRKRHTITIQVFGMTEGTNDLLLDFGITFQFSGGMCVSSGVYFEVNRIQSLRLPMKTHYRLIISSESRNGCKRAMRATRLAWPPSLHIRLHAYFL
ncbi:hypothetical protein BCR34DRAFT_179129 [Clohesyomyces aquaticus]|uniref:Uncharacterized protein n=1 Tax=Clohesyomyces aquaticus TaxID=1231657 RepID=A0A1Y1YFB9_9PLEO|nr:hypothetical protein BCR34DRAFT_179129 [Clohesyomyces aquaticus]